MRSVAYIVFVMIAMCAGADLKAQDKQGSVVIHTDPRLSLLLKKAHNTDGPRVVKPRKASRPKQIAGTIPTGVTDKTTGVVNTTTANAVPAAQPGVAGTAPENGTAGTTAPAAKNVGVVSSAPVNMPAEAVPTPLPMENGHVAGWTPPVRKTRVIYSGKGYRVQIYNGPDRNKAIQVKTDFMRAYPGVRVYLSYISPAFRVKVGDYRNRSDAHGMLKQANSVYNPSMIVPDIITISTF